MGRRAEHALLKWIWHFESYGSHMDQTHGRINPKAVIIDWKNKLYIQPEYAVAATETKWE